MALTGQRTFVGFGFGAIQAGLFLHEAFRSGGFRRLVVAEVQPEVVSAVRQAQGRFCVNIAHFDRVEVAHTGPLEIIDPSCPHDRTALIEALAEAAEIATAVPSIRHYVSNGPGSIHRLLAEGLRKKAARGGPRAVVYAAENHNHAAEILGEAVLEHVPGGERESVSSHTRFLNTVIGKMSGIVIDPAEICRQGLTAIAPTLERAFLVEAFNRILISRIHFDQTGDGSAFQRGITVFQEKDDLLPFEEAKLYGHNATHALAAYVGAVRGVERIADLCKFPDIMRYLRSAFIRESGEALIRKHKTMDALFTPEGYREYADDLLARMVNPYLHDTVERVGRDCERKLGWDDRLTGTVRLARREGLEAHRYAMGIAAGLETLNRADTSAATVLDSLWSGASPDPEERRAVLSLVESASIRLRAWRDSGFPDLEAE